MSRSKVAVFLAVVFTGSVLQAIPVYFSGNGHYYERIDAAFAVTDWDQAVAAAAGLSYAGVQGHLVTLTSQAEQDFVFANLCSSPVDEHTRYWLGGYQPPGSPEPDGNWQWLTGETWDYTNWAPGEPNDMPGFGDENALHILASTGQWNDVNRSVTHQNRGYLVEFSVPSQPVPDVACTLALLGGALAALSGLRLKTSR